MLTEVNMDNYFSRYVQLALSGDDSAFEALYNLTKDQLYFVILNITKNKSVALDIMQDCYISAFDNLSTLDLPEYFDLWLNRIASNSVKIFIENNNPELFKDLGDYNIDDWDESENQENLPQETVDDKETRRLINQIINNLPDDLKLIIIMYYYQQMSVAVISSTLEVSENYVKHNLIVARKTIKENIEKSESDGILTRHVTISAVPFVLSEEAKSQFFFNPAPAFPNVISISSENREETYTSNEHTSITQPLAQELSSQQPSYEQVLEDNDYSINPEVSQHSSDIDMMASEEIAVARDIPTSELGYSQEFIQPTDEPEEEFSFNNEQISFNEDNENEDKQEIPPVVGISDNENNASRYDSRPIESLSGYNSPKDTGKTSKKQARNRNMTSSRKNVSSFISSTAGKVVAAILAIALVGIGVTITVIIAAQNNSISEKSDNSSGSTYSRPDILSDYSEDESSVQESKALTEEELQKEDAVNYSYKKKSDGTLIITQYNGKLENIVIPDEIDGKKVTGIGYQAFQNGSGIKSITLSKYIDNIWVGAGNAVNNPFVDCIYLKNIYVVSGNAEFSAENGVLYNKKKTRLIAYPSGKTEQSFEIPKTVKSIFYGAFSDNLSLEEITIPSGVTSIAQRAFYNCSSLKGIVIPEGVKHILEGTFSNCSSLVSVSLPKNLESIDEMAFYRCNSLENIVMPENLEYIKSTAFMECTMLETITIPNSQTILDEGDVENLKYGSGIFYLSPVTIKAPKGSKAEQYAKKCKIPFEAL